jgi:surface antigen
MLKQKVRKFKVTYLFGAVFIASVFALPSFYNVYVHADQFDEQIQALRAQNASTQQVSDSLAAQANTYQGVVDSLAQQIDSLQQTIVAYQQQSDATQAEIDQKQADLDQQKKVLGEDIKQMYLEGQTSTLEILASSNNLSDFVNKEVGRSAVQNKVKSSVDQINTLKLQLEEKQRELQGLIKDQQTQQAQLQTTESQQSQLLAFTEEQKATYDQQIKANNSQIADLRAQQLAANRTLGGVPVAGDPNHGGYPAQWANAPQDSTFDNWGMLNRECVSYTAWKVYQAYGYMPYWGGVGNANQWPGDAQAAGIPTGSTPKVGSVAISMAGGYGHAMWVEAVNGSNIYVSQYNYDLAGHYSEMSINGSGLTYIYFGQ